MPLLRRFQSPAPGKLDLRQVFEKQGDRLPKRAETAGADLGASAVWSADWRLKALTKTSPGLVPALAASCLSVVHPSATVHGATAPGTAAEERLEQIGTILGAPDPLKKGEGGRH